MLFLNFVAIFGNLFGMLTERSGRDNQIYCLDASLRASSQLPHEHRSELQRWKHRAKTRAIELGRAINIELALIAFHDIAHRG
jgi:hypothetical protein